jgi:phosphotransferase system HPr-like phosphotransfer protein
MEDREKIMRCLYAVVDHYKVLEEQKADCTANVDAELSLLVGECEKRITNDDKKAVKKLAKAMATDKENSLKSELKSLVDLLSTKTRGGIQLELFGSGFNAAIETLSKHDVSIEGVQ